MPWLAIDTVLKRRALQKGVAPILEAVSLCVKAQELCPGTFHAVSVRRGTLHLRLPKRNQLKLKLCEGKLVQELNAYAAQKGIAPVERIRLTFDEDVLL